MQARPSAKANAASSKLSDTAVMQTPDQRAASKISYRKRSPKSVAPKEPSQKRPHKPTTAGKRSHYNARIAPYRSRPPPAYLPAVPKTSPCDRQCRPPAKPTKNAPAPPHARTVKGAAREQIPAIANRPARDPLLRNLGLAFSAVPMRREGLRHFPTQPAKQEILARIL